MDKIALMRAISEQRKSLYSFLHARCPPKVRDGSHQQAVAFKAWCEDAQRSMNRQLPVNETTLRALEDLASRYMQFLS
jgi:hypothetical protein